MKKFARGMKRAFTITELVIVIAVIAILAAVLIPTFSSVISSARESAAMQECRNALTDYSVQAQEKEQDITGIVFINNEYAYVNLSGNLHLLGKLEKLENIMSDGAKSKGTAPSGIAGFSETKTFTGGRVTITMTDEKGDAAPAKTVSLTENKVEPTKTGDEAVHAKEVLYLYSVTVNDVTYVGYFTYEQPGEAKFITDNQTVYSRAFGYVVLKDSAKMTLAAAAAE